MSTVDTQATLQTENARLQSRIEELEASLAEKKKHSKSARTETDKLREDKLDDATDEAHRLLRAMAQAFVEQLRAAADVVSAVADEANKRSEVHSARSEKGVRERIDHIGDDIAGIVNKGIEVSLTTPRRVVDKFHEVYHQV